MNLRVLVALFALLILVAPTTALQLDNDGGGNWSRYIHIPLNVPDYLQLRVEINGSNVYVYDADGNVTANGTTSFWNYVQSDGDDIRVANQSAQLYFWVEEWNYTNRFARLWINVSNGSTEVNIYYGNPNATKSSYFDPLKTFLFFQDFDYPPVWKISEGLSKPSNDTVLVNANGEWLQRYNGTAIEKYTSGIIEFRAKFYSGYTDGNAYVGFGSPDGSPPYAFINNRLTGSNLWMNTNWNGTGEVTDLGATYLDSWHVYKIVRNSTGTYYYVDDVLVAKHSANTDTPTPITIASSGNAVEVDWVKFYDLNGTLLWESNFSYNEFYVYLDVYISVSNSTITQKAKSATTWGKTVTLSKPFKVNTVLRAKGDYVTLVPTENTKYIATGVGDYTTDSNRWHTGIGIDQDGNRMIALSGDGSTWETITLAPPFFKALQEVVRHPDYAEFKLWDLVNNTLYTTTSTVVGTFDEHISIHSCSSPSEVKTEWILVYRYLSPSNVYHVVDLAINETPPPPPQPPKIIKFYDVKYLIERDGLAIGVNSTFNITDLMFRWDLDGDGIWDVYGKGLNSITCSYDRPDTYTVTVEVEDPNGQKNSTTITVHVAFRKPIVGAKNYINKTGFVTWADKSGRKAFAEVKPKRVERGFYVTIHEENINASKHGEVILNVTFDQASGEIWLNETVLNAYKVDILHDGKLYKTVIVGTNKSINLTLSEFSTYTIIVNKTLPTQITPTPAEIPLTQIIVLIVLVVLIVTIIVIAKRRQEMAKIKIESEFRFFRRL